MSARPTVRIDGSGIAAAALALFCSRRGFAVTRGCAVEAAGPRVVAIPEDTAHLLSSLAGVDIERELLHRRIVRRRVAWDSRVFEEVPARVLVVDAAALTQVLREKADAAAGDAASVSEHEPHDWWFSSHRGEEGVHYALAGSRVALTGWISELPGFDEGATHVAAVPQGWLFAAPRPSGGIVINAVIAANHRDQGSLLEQAVRFVWPAAGKPQTGSGLIPCAPRLALARAETGPIPLGENALFLDPLRGDGVGHAIRGAWLAHALVESVANGGISREQSESHYFRRLAAVFARHLDACLQHYRNSWNASCWTGEIRSMQACAVRISAPLPRFRLNCNRLEPEPSFNPRDNRRSGT